MIRGWQKLLLLLILIFMLSAVDSWRRRRRRRYVPPPPVHCVVSSWSSYGSCSESCSVGQQYRYRSLLTHPQYGGSACPGLSESRQCGQSNGGCEHYCRNGVCSCRTGFYLAGKSCNDRDECASNGGRGPCDQICVNVHGSYICQCQDGYSLDSNAHSCTPKDCGAILLNNCPSDTYKDNFMDVCEKATSVCPSGTRFNQQCTLQCPKDYRLAKIGRKTGQPFAKDYSEVDFISVYSTVTCIVASSGVQWNYASEITSYYCRRTNDPPTSLFLSGHSILEHSPRGTLIGNLSTLDPQTDQTFTYSVQSFGRLSFFQIQGNGLINDWIPMLNGPLTLINSSVDVTIRVSDSGAPNMWIDKTFTIFVENVNDPPHSLGLSDNVVNESASIGEVVGKLTAVDGDDPFGTSPHSDNFIWTLVDADDNFFRLDGVNVAVNRTLNHESKSNHLITVKCTDFGSPPKSVTKRFIINVLNTNDKPLSISISHSSVNENSVIGTLVGKFVASDEDKDPLDFYIGYSDSATLQKFKLEQNPSCQMNEQSYTCSQELRVNDHLDYESQRTYLIVVTVNDSISRLTKTFNLSLVNVNEWPTKMHFNGPQDINENTPVDSIIGSFRVTDPDNKNYPIQTHTCQIIPSRDSSYFNIIQKVQVLVQQNIDFETTSMLNITVKCVDSGNPPLDIVKEFFFTVTDVNEPPTNLTISSNTVPENSPNGTVIGILSSNDPEKAHQSFTYDIIEPPVVPFVIGGANGTTLMVNGGIDYEVTPYININVRVRDSGGLSLVKQLRINVEDVNDPPTTIQVPHLDMKENSVENILISPVNVLDQDGNVNGCRLIDDADGRFKLVGMNLVAGPTMTDFESIPQPKTLTIKLNCSDMDGKSVSRSIAMNVQDVNEPPSALKLHSYQSSILENKPDIEVGEVLVQDPDTDQNHSCSITGAANQVFTVREVNNKIVLKTINRGLDFEANIDHNIMVSVSCIDLVPSTQPQFSITRDFRIDIRDENEVPTGRCSNNTLYIPYLASNGSIVGPLLASDPDNDEFYKKLTGKRKQSLSLTRVATTPPLPFVVVDGNIVRSGAVEKNRKYVISVKVKDNGFIIGDDLDGKPVFVQSPPKSSVFNCSIIIEGEDNYVKDILLQPNTVSQTARNGTIIGSLSTVTQYPNETFTYKLLEQGQLPFAVIGTQLLVTASDLMNYQASMTPQVQVTISSYGSISGEIVKNFYIIIIDFNEKPANMCLLHNTVKENQPANTIVGQILIEDPDYPYLTCSRGSTGQTVSHQAAYSCQVGKDEDEFNSAVAAMFTVDSSLMLKTTMPLNYELFALVNGSVRVHVLCSDHVHSIRESLVVYIIDGPDSPKDLQLVCCADVDCSSEEETNLFEGEPLKQCQIVPDIVLNSQPGHVIGYLKTKDEDKGDVFTFSLANVSSYFEVKPGHGNLPKAIGMLQLKNQNFTVSNNNNLKVYPVTITTEDHSQLSYTKTILLVNKDVCKDNKCVATSSCSRHSNLEGYDCICPNGWRGNGLRDGTGCSECKVGQTGNRNNECHEINECLSNPCMNHGTCVDGTASYTCECVTGFTGKRCESNIDYCKDKPCKNKGVCEDQDKKFACKCSEGFQGRTCDRQPSLCNECSDNEETMCVTFENAGIRCVGPEYQIPIVNNQGVLSTDQLYEMESEIASLLDANVDSLMSRRRRSVSIFYVEVLQKAAKNQSDSQALLFFAALDITNQYKPLKASDACKALANTQYRCPSKGECEALANKGSSCPSGYASGQGSTPETGMSSGAIAGIGALVIIVIIMLLMGAVFYYRRKYKHEKNKTSVRYRNAGSPEFSDDNRIHFNTEDQEHINFSNPVYDTGSPRHRLSPKMDPHLVEDMLKDHLSKRELVIGNLDPSSVKKRNDVKVMNNPTYLQPGASYGAAPTYEDIDNVKRANKASKDDTKCSRTLGKSVDGTTSDPLYESLKKAKKPSKVKLAPEEDIDTFKAAAKESGTMENRSEPKYSTAVPGKAVVKLPQYENLEQLKKSSEHEATRKSIAKQEARSRYENINPTQTYFNWKEFEDLNSLKAAIRADTNSDDIAKETKAPEVSNPKVKDTKRKRSYGRQRSFGNTTFRNPVYEALDSNPSMNLPDEELSRDRQGSIRAVENPRYESFKLDNGDKNSDV